MPLITAAWTDSDALLKACRQAQSAAQFREMEWLPPSPDGIAMCQGRGVQSHAKRRTAK